MDRGAWQSSAHGTGKSQTDRAQQQEAHVVENRGNNTEIKLRLCT